MIMIVDSDKYKSWRDFKGIGEFEKYLRQDCGASSKDYCEEILKKVDPVSNNSIYFRSLEQYLLTDFENKSNFLKWLKLADSENAQKYLLDSIIRYVKIKEAHIFPSHFDLRTMRNMPSFKTYLKFFETSDFSKVVSSAGSVLRYDYSIKKVTAPVDLIKKIKCDTREQKPIKFSKDIEVEIGKLDFGDYWAGGGLFIERKALADLISTLSSGWTRFNKEIQRAKEAGAYCLILVDCDINDFLGFKYMRDCRYVKASEDFIFKRCRDLNRSFPDTVQFLFSGGRRESANLIPFLFSWKNQEYKKLDLQYIKDSNGLFV